MGLVCRVERNDCTGCGICVDVCGFGALRMGREDAFPVELAGACTGCRDCEHQCPFDAILMVEPDPSLRLS